MIMRNLAIELSRSHPDAIALTLHPWHGRDKPVRPLRPQCRIRPIVHARSQRILPDRRHRQSGARGQRQPDRVDGQKIPF